jgi:hypothetical protein
MNTKHFLVGLILTLTLVGCARSSVPGPIGTPAPSPLISPLAVPDVYITYQRSGGFVGANDTWTIDPQGKVIHQGSGTSTQLTSDQLTELTVAIRSANFTAFADSYIPKDTCCDRYEYAITITLNDHFKTVRTSDASPTAPMELTQLVDTLNRLVPSPGPAAQ